MRAFIFSLDAFVAFTLALVAIYSLIFFSSVPSSYYYLLTQGHYLTRDVLLSLSTTTCDYDYYNCKTDGSMLDNIVAEDNPAFKENLIRGTIGQMIPNQFGYRVEISSDHGTSWDMVYDTATGSAETHADQSKKLSVSSQVISFGYSGKVNKLENSPYDYLTCGFAADGGSSSSGDGDVDWGIITCGTTNITSGDGNETAIGNVHPSGILGGDLVPSSDVKVVKLTVYI